MTFDETPVNSLEKSNNTYSTIIEPSTAESAETRKKKSSDKKDQLQKLEQRLAALRAEVAEDEKKERERNSNRVIKLLKENELAFVDISVWTEKLPQIRTILEAI